MRVSACCDTRSFAQTNIKSNLNYYTFGITHTNEEANTTIFGWSRRNDGNVDGIVGPNDVGYPSSTNPRYDSWDLAPANPLSELSNNAYKVQYTLNQADGTHNNAKDFIVSAPFTGFQRNPDNNRIVNFYTTMTISNLANFCAKIIGRALMAPHNTTNPTKLRFQYSLNNGSTWKDIGSGATDEKIKNVHFGNIVI